MAINWFPGHMAKSTREIENALKAADCVLYVLDCRAVKSCFNPSFDRMINVPIVYLLNKADTVTEDVPRAWIKKLSTGANTAVAIDGRTSCKKKILAAIYKVCAAKLERQKRRGLNAHLRAIVVGVPNTGKSTVINSLCQKARLATGNKAGVTRAALWARVDETLDVLDTPGTLYPKITDETVGFNLAAIGSVRDEVTDKVEVAEALIAKLNEIDADILRSRFGDKSEHITLNDIAEAREYKKGGGILDLERAANAVIDDFRKGRLGKIALEKTDGN